MIALINKEAESSEQQFMNCGTYELRMESKTGIIKTFSDLKRQNVVGDNAHIQRHA